MGAGPGLSPYGCIDVLGVFRPEGRGTAKEEEALPPAPKRTKASIPLRQADACNDLQHYAPLGGDIIGARWVTLEAIRVREAAGLLQFVRL